MKASIVAFSLLSTLVSGLALPEVVPRGAETFPPSLAVNVKQDSPNAAIGSASTGEVSKNVQTLVSFSVPARPNTMCTFAFSNPVGLTETQRMKIYKVDADKITDKVTFGTKPEPQGSYCTVAVPPSGPATLEGGDLCKINCPDEAAVWGFELVPASDNDKITWELNTSGTSGLTIQTV